MRELEAWTYAHMRGRAIAGFGGQVPQMEPQRSEDGAEGKQRRPEIDRGVLCYTVNAPGWVAAVDLSR